MGKLELKDIAGYLPYRLGIECSITKARRMLGYYKNIDGLWAVVNDPDEDDCISNTQFDDITPILRPISDLTKEIIHKGQTFVPIVELAKISMGEIWADGIHNPQIKEGKTTWNGEIIKDAYGIEFTDADDIMQFAWSISHKCFLFNYKNQILHHHVFRQYQISDKLNEWMFDYRGLIEKGLAIDVNTLENNCYEK